MSMNSTPSGERVHIGFFGRRNAGKSSVVNAVTGQDLAVVSDVKGTTTDPVKKAMELLPLGPVMIIDTPGMRELGMWDVSEGLGDAFADVEAFIGKCRFSDCKHLYEPGCAIQDALAFGRLDPKRWASYQKLKEEAVSKEEMLRRKNEWHKSLRKGERMKKKEIW